MRYALVAALCALLPRTGDCQLQPPPGPGSRVRVTFADPSRERQTGLLVGLSDSVHFAVQTRSNNWSDTLAIPKALIRQLEVSDGEKKHTVTGMLIGLVAGTAVVASLTSTQKRCEDDRKQCFGEGLIVIVIPAVGLGALIGSGVRTERWRPVEF